MQSKQLELRAFPSQDLHAKVYISRFPEAALDYGRVVTGSSNFSLNGLVAQREFNVELKDHSDVEFALKKFEELWQDGVDVSAAYVDTIQQKTWLSDTITPYEIYLKFLYEWFREDINLDNEVDIEMPEGFMDLAYQKQAVISARKILEAYGGVFIADVVGLGKTYISAMLLQGYAGRKLVICPPTLESYWRETFLEFGVRGVEVQSLGKLDEIIEKGTEKYSYVLIDEAHRFRTDTTQTYEKLHQICWSKRVILVSATPLNNRLEDILSLIKLFQPARKSSIPGLPNLEAFFKEQAQKLKVFEKDDPAYLEAVKEDIASFWMCCSSRASVNTVLEDFGRKLQSGGAPWISKRSRTSDARSRPCSTDLLRRPPAARRLKPARVLAWRKTWRGCRPWRCRARPIPMSETDDQDREARMKAILNADGSVAPAADLPPGLLTAEGTGGIKGDVAAALADGHANGVMAQPNRYFELQAAADAEADRLLCLPDPTVPIDTEQGRIIEMDMDELLLETFGSREVAEAWLNAPNPVLAGETPASYIRRGDTEAIRRLLLMAATGMPT
ncbi:SNF2-related protein (plasmid) [Deinococcus radiomollis]|uniref:SNF2-related protein n=1 Tax=Deinococcus radiomollis TaxID=468916 RepID=UPI0038917D3F